MTAKNVGSLEHVDADTGQRSYNNRMVGTTDSNDNDAGRVVLGPNEFAVSGTLHSYAMLPLDAALTGSDAATVLWTNAVGCRAYRIKVGEAIGAGEKLVHKSSTTASDDLSSDLNSADIDITTPTGGDLNGIASQAIGEEVGDWISWDGTNPIKTISMRMTGGALTIGLAVMLETLE